MSDGDFSTARQWSDSSSDEGALITFRFTSAFSGAEYFTKMITIDGRMKVGHLFHIVELQLKLGNCAFRLKVGKKVWRNRTQDLNELFWICQSAQDDLGDSAQFEVEVQVIKVITPEDWETRKIFFMFRHVYD